MFFNIFGALILIFSWFFITKMYDHMLDHLHGLEWFFSHDFDVFWLENTLFLWRKVMFYVIFSEANVLKHCVFSVFLRDFLSWKKSSEKIDSGSVDEAFWRDFSCGNTWFWNEKEWFFSRFFNSFVYKERDFLFFFNTFFRLQKCIVILSDFYIWIAILPQRFWVPFCGKNSE